MISWWSRAAAIGRRCKRSSRRCAMKMCAPAFARSAWSRPVTRRLAATLMLLPLMFGAAQNDAHAQLRGHGGPVRALAISADGKTALSGSFDTSAIRWSLERNAAEQVLRFHDSAVNAVAILPDGRLVTGGEDGKIAIWRPGAARPGAAIYRPYRADRGAGSVAGRQAHCVGVVDRTVRIWPADGGAATVLEGHQQNVNGVAFTPDGKSLVSASSDPEIRIWPLDGGPAKIARLLTPLNSVAVAPDGEIVAGGADGKVYFFSASGEASGTVEASPIPIIAVAVAVDGKRVAAAGIRGSVAIIERAGRKLEHTLVGPGLPVWSVAFFPDSHTLLTGGTDRMIRRWDAVSGEPIGGRQRPRPTIHSAFTPAIRVRRCSAPVSPATRCRRTKATKRGRALPAFSAVK